MDSCVGLALHARTSQAAAGEVEFGDVIIELANGGWQSEASVFLQRDIAAPGLHPDQLEGQLTCGPENHSIGFCLCRLGATKAKSESKFARTLELILIQAELVQVRQSPQLRGN